MNNFFEQSPVSPKCNNALVTLSCLPVFMSQEHKNSGAVIDRMHKVSNSQLNWAFGMFGADILLTVPVLALVGMYAIPPSIGCECLALLVGGGAGCFWSTLSMGRIATEKRRRRDNEHLPSASASPPLTPIEEAPPTQQGFSSDMGSLRYTPIHSPIMFPR